MYIILFIHLIQNQESNNQIMHIIHINKNTLYTLSLNHSTLYQFINLSLNHKHTYTINILSSYTNDKYASIIHNLTLYNLIIDLMT